MEDIKQETYQTSNNEVVQLLEHSYSTNLYQYQVCVNRPGPCMDFRRLVDKRYTDRVQNRSKTLPFMDPCFRPYENNVLFSHKFNQTFNQYSISTQH